MSKSREWNFIVFLLVKAVLVELKVWIADSWLGVVDISKDVYDDVNSLSIKYSPPLKMS